MKQLTIFLAGLLLAALLFGCSSSSTEPLDTCVAPAPAQDAAIPAGMVDETSAILPNGRRISPAGRTMPINAVFPHVLAQNKAGTLAFVVATQDDTILRYSRPLLVMDLATNTRVAAFNLQGTSYGIALSGDDKTLYVGGGVKGVVQVLDVSDINNIHITRTISLPAGYVGPLFLTGDETTLYAADSAGGYLHKITLADDTHQGVKVGFSPRNLLVNKQETLAFLANNGGNSVSVVDLTTFTVQGEIAVGKAPMGMALSDDEGELFVANADSSSISVVDVSAGAVTHTIDLEDFTGLAKANPTALYHDISNGRLYVACAYMNALYLVDTKGANYQVFGKIPTGSYPTFITPGVSGDTLLVINAYGWGGTPNGYPRVDTGEAVPGTLSVIPLPQNDAELADMTKTVDDNNARPASYYDNTTCQRLIPLAEGGQPPIEHVVLIVKENKTFDEVLGDLKDRNGNQIGDGDPNLTLFGEEISPNGHELARQFTVSDNFYCDSEVSLQGHVWLTFADCNDYTNRNRFDQLVLGGIEDESRSEGQSIFQFLSENGVSFRDYGEMVAFLPEVFTDEYLDNYDTKVSFYNQNVSDVSKAREIIREMNNGIFKTFTFISLPNDHTHGGDPGKPTPRFAVADNDYGWGLLVEAISHSKYWENTVIFVLQDDTQSASGDHVDSHRGLFWAISPWVKRGYLSSIHYSFPSVYRTIEMLLGLPHMNQNTATAAPMYDIFTSEPDFTPYTAIKPDIPWETNPDDASKAARKSRTYDWTYVDGHKGLGDVIWEIMRPGQQRPSYAKRLDE